MARGGIQTGRIGMMDRASRRVTAICAGGLIWLLAGAPGVAFAAEAAEGKRAHSRGVNGAQSPFVQVNQGGADDTESHELSQIFPPLRRDLRRTLSRAETALRERRYSDAVAELDVLLNGPEVEDYFIESLDPEGTRTSLKAQVRQLLGSMPAEGLEAYQLQFGAEGGRLLEEAIARGDIEKLTEVSRRYFHTQAGYEATILGAHYWLSQGRPLAAAILLQRFEEAPTAAEKFEPELSLLSATCWRCANNPEAAAKTLIELASRFPRANFTVRGHKVELVDLSSTATQDKPAAALTWLDTVIGTQRIAQRPTLTEWLLYRGSPARNASSAGGIPLFPGRWRIPTANDWEDEQEAEKLLKRYLDRSVPALPALHPLVIGNTVLMRSPRELLAVDLTTGKRIWLYPWDRDLATWSLDDAHVPPGDRATSSSGNSVPNRRELELHQRIWEDAAYGQLCSDGESVFLLDQMEFASVPGLASPRLVPGPFGGFQISGPWSNNRLVALDLGTQGKLRWAVGQAQDGDPGDDPRLADTFFLGPPLPLAGQLYILAEINAELRLLVLDAKTGQLQWSQQLAHFEAPHQAISLSAMRRLAGATPSFGEGILVCPISAGAVVAVDLATRSLRWGYQYKTQWNQGSGGGGPWNQGLLVPSQLPPSGTRWSDATATVADGRVLLTPLESDQLHCLDLLTGKPVWPPAPRQDNLFIACVHHGIVVLVGKHQVSAIHLADGKPAWAQEIPLPSNAMPGGRGFLSDDSYYLPTTARELLRIHVGDGTHEAMRTDVLLGNLVCHEGQIISQGAESLEAFYQVDQLRVIVERRLAEDPDDPWALEHLGMLAINRGQPAEALEPLRRALERYPQDAPRRDAAQALLVRTLLGALRADFQANQALAAEVDQLIDQPDQRNEYLRLMAKGLEENGQHARAFGLYLEMAQSRGAGTLRAGSAELSASEIETADRQLRIKHERWLSGVFRQLLGAASEDQRQEMLARIESLRQDALEAESLTALRTFVAYFQSHPVADKARLRLAERLIDLDQLLEAELALAGLADSPEVSTAATASALTARLLEKAGRDSESAAWYERVADRYHDIVTVEGKTGEQLFESRGAAGPLAAARRATSPWPSGGVLITESKESATPATSNPLMQLNSRPYVVPFRQRDLALPEGSRLVLSRQADLVGLLDGWGQLKRHVRLPQANFGPSARNYLVTYAKTYGHLLLLSFGMEVVAIDTLSTESPTGMEVLWHENLSSQVPGLPSSFPRPRPTPRATPFGTRYVATGPDGKPVGLIGTITRFGVCYQVGRELRCVSPLTNDPMWVRSVDAAGSDLFGDDQLVFVVPPGSTSAQVLSATDGQELGHRKVPVLEQRWTTVGRNILTWDDSARGEPQTRLSLFDPWTATDVWSYSFPPGSLGWLVAEDEVGIMQRDGRFVLISLVDGTKIIDATLEPENRLTNIYVGRYPDQYVVVTSGPFTPAPNTSIDVFPSDPTTQRINGRVYALDRQTGKLLWPAPALVENFGLPLDQPAISPVLIFLRNVTRTSNNRARTQRGSQRAEILCIDRRDGTAVLAKGELPPSRWYEATADPEKHTVTVRLQNSSTFQLEFTDQPRDPEPPAQKDDAASLGSLRSHLTNLARTLAEALGGEGSPQSKPAENTPAETTKP